MAPESVVVIGRWVTTSNVEVGGAPRKRGRRVLSAQATLPFTDHAGSGVSQLPGVRAGTPDIDAGKQEEPDDVDEVPIPGGEFKSEMLRRLEVTGQGAE